jgi:hypothetical protein
MQNNSTKESLRQSLMREFLIRHQQWIFEMENSRGKLKAKIT